jgi:excisionase family DNA binding protein
VSAMPAPESGDLEYLTIDDVARLLQVSRRTVNQWRRMGRGPRSFRLPKGVRYRRADVELWVDQQLEERLKEPPQDQGD